MRWSGEHVPGSPFVTMIFDTEEELARFNFIVIFIILVVVVVVHWHIYHGRQKNHQLRMFLQVPTGGLLPRRAS